MQDRPAFRLKHLPQVPSRVLLGVLALALLSPLQAQGPVIESAGFSGLNFRFEWASSPYHTYRVDASEDVTGWSPLLETNSPGERRLENESRSIRLIAGTRYAVEALMKDGIGGDNLAVTWRRSGKPAPQKGDPPIPSAFLTTVADPAN